MHWTRVWPLIPLVALASGCPACRSPVDDPRSKVPASCEGEQPLLEPQKLDILFVIDNSGSMAEEQEGVARELTAFINEVRQGGGVAQDFHVGVITTGIYRHTLVNGVRGYREYPSESGKLQPVPDPATDAGVASGERVLSGDDAAIVEKFARLVRQGTFGTGQETPFEAIRLALATELASTPMEQGGNGGFLREGARLLVVVVTDEDDCSETARPPVVWVGNDPSRDYCTEQTTSLTPVETYYDLLRKLDDGRGGQRDVVFAAIGPVGRSTKQAQGILDNGVVRNVDCPTSYEPGYRIRKMAELFDTGLVNLDSICRDSYRETLIAIAGLANISQTLEIRNVPDPRLLKVEITRRDGAVVPCTVQNGGIESYDEPDEERPGRIHFGANCRRRADDTHVDVKMLCAG